MLPEFYLSKSYVKLHSGISSAGGKTEGQCESWVWSFEASLGYTVRPYLKNTMKELRIQLSG